jgi:hypothetical protein
MLAIAVALSLVGVADNIQAAAVDMMYAFGLCGALAGVALRPSAAAAVTKAKRAPGIGEEPGIPDAGADPEPEPVLEPERPLPVRPSPLSSVRTRLGSWLRGRR